VAENVHHPPRSAAVITPSTSAAPPANPSPVPIVSITTLRRRGAPPPPEHFRAITQWRRQLLLRDWESPAGDECHLRIWPSRKFKSSRQAFLTREVGGSKMPCAANFPIRPATGALAAFSKRSELTCAGQRPESVLRRLVEKSRVRSRRVRPRRPFGLRLHDVKPPRAQRGAGIGEGLCCWLTMFLHINPVLCQFTGNMSTR